MAKVPTLRSEALEDFFVFAKDVLRMPVEVQPHQEMAQFISSRYSSRKLLLVPRDCWKTSLASIAFPLWRVLRAYFVGDNPCHRVMIDSATVRLSKFCISTIESYVKNHETLRSVFGELYDRKGRTDEGYSLAFRMKTATGIKEPNFFPSGVGAEKTGLHFEDILMDDVVTKTNVTTPDQRAKVHDHYKRMNAIMEESEKDAENNTTTNLTLIGTRYHDDDLYGRIIKEDKKAVAEGSSPLFSTMIRQAVDIETGDLFFPTKLSHEVLEKKKRAMGVTFFAQYMNDPNQENAPFKKEWLKWDSLINFPELTAFRITVDPALKMEQSDHGDYCTLIAMGWTKFHAPYVIDVVMDDQMTVPAFISALFSMAMRWNIKEVLIEADHQEALELLLRREMFERAYPMRIQWEKTSRTYGKMTRWAEIQPYAERCGVHIAEEIPSSARIEIQDQWERCPVASHDDFMDALSLQMLYLPIEFSERGMRQPVGPQRPEEILKEQKAERAESFGFVTLADRFPHIKALQKAGDEQEQYAPSEEQTIYEEMMASFNAH